MECTNLETHEIDPGHFQGKNYVILIPVLTDAHHSLTID